MGARLLIGYVLKYCKVPKYYDQDCRYQVSAQSDNFDFLNQIHPKKVFSVKRRKSEHPHGILHI